MHIVVPKNIKINFPINFDVEFNDEPDADSSFSNSIIILKNKQVMDDYKDLVFKEHGYSYSNNQLKSIDFQNFVTINDQHNTAVLYDEGKYTPLTYDLDTWCNNEILQSLLICTSENISMYCYADADNKYLIGIIKDSSKDLSLTTNHFLSGTWALINSEVKTVKLPTYWKYRYITSPLAELTLLLDSTTKFIFIDQDKTTQDDYKTLTPIKVLPNTMFDYLVNKVVPTKPIVPNNNTMVVDIKPIKFELQDFENFGFDPKTHTVRNFSFDGVFTPKKLMTCMQMLNNQPCFLFGEAHDDETYNQNDYYTNVIIKMSKYYQHEHHILIERILYKDGITDGKKNIEVPDLYIRDSDEHEKNHDGLTIGQYLDNLEKLIGYLCGIKEPTKEELIKINFSDFNPQRWSGMEAFNEYKKCYARAIDDKEFSKKIYDLAIKYHINVIRKSSKEYLNEKYFGFVVYFDQVLLDIPLLIYANYFTKRNETVIIIGGKRHISNFYYYLNDPEKLPKHMGDHILDKTELVDKNDTIKTVLAKMAAFDPYCSANACVISGGNNTICINNLYIFILCILIMILIYFGSYLMEYVINIRKKKCICALLIVCEKSDFLYQYSTIKMDQTEQKSKNKTKKKVRRQYYQLETSLNLQKYHLHW